MNGWIFEARRLGIPTLLLVDGPLEWANVHHNPSLSRPGAEAARALFEPVVHDAVACIGDAQSTWIAHKNEGRGVTRMSYASQRIGSSHDAATPNSQSEADRRFDFLVSTAKTPAFDEREKANLATVLAACGEALEAAGYRTLVRLFDPDLRRTMAAAAPSATFEQDGSFEEALALTRCVIGTPSSVLLEAMQHRRPTGTLMFRDSPLFYQTGWLLGCNTDWRSSFESMLAHDPARIDLQRKTLRDNLSEEDFFAHCERIAEGTLLPRVRPLDGADLEFENRVLRGLLGWRARWLAPLLRVRSRSRGETKDD